MKITAVLSLLALGLAITCDAGEPSASARSVKPTSRANPQIDFPGFVSLSRDVQAIRKTRLVPIAKFNQMAEDKKTIILDTRSKAAFESIHVKGAIHLNFSDFTADKLATMIPNKNTRILIYCNNNFVAERVPELAMKRFSLALNIPTFVNLYGYGYENVFELADALKLGDSRVQLAGTRFDKKLTLK